MIYLDNAATTLVKPECVKQAVYEAMGAMGNSGRALHEPGLYAARKIYAAREEAAAFFGAQAAQTAFTCNATEALNIAVSGLAKPGSHVITTELEHNSVLRPLYRAQKLGTEVTILKADEKGNISLEEMEAAVRPDTAGIICTHASNVTGNVLPLKEIGDLCRQREILLAADVSQTAGSLPVHMKAMGIHMLCFTGHKGLLGPQGTGGLCVDSRVVLSPLRVGGSGVSSFSEEQPSQMPEVLEAGTVNGHGIAGLGAAFSYFRETGIQRIQAHERKLTQLFYEQVEKIPGVKVYGDFQAKERAPVVSLNIGDYDAKETGEALWQEFSIAVRAGIHCAPLMHRALGTMKQGTVRFSFSWFNTEQEAEEAAWAVGKLAKA